MVSVRQELVALMQSSVVPLQALAASAGCIRNAVVLRDSCDLTVSSCAPDVLGLPGLFGLGANLRYMGYFRSLLHPQEENFGCYHKSGTCLRVLENHVLLSFWWS